MSDFGFVLEMCSECEFLNSWTQSELIDQFDKIGEWDPQNQSLHGHTEFVRLLLQDGRADSVTITIYDPHLRVLLVDDLKAAERVQVRLDEIVITI